MPSLAIETHGLGKRFGDRAALESIDLEVPRGCAFGFLGRNGAGKTTLVRLLLGLAQPTSGTMRLIGHDLPGGRAEALARVGAIVEEPRFHPHLTGRENLHVHAAARDASAHGRVEGALTRVGLGGRADDKVKTYSLGMRQRLGVARCLLCDPELLISSSAGSSARWSTKGAPCCSRRTCSTRSRRPATWPRSSTTGASSSRARSTR
jgi:ABC-2 type transport system ATP-binding protein